MSEVTKSAEIATILSTLRHNMTSMLDDVKFIGNRPGDQDKPWFGVSALRESIQLLDQLKVGLDRNDSMKGARLRSALASIYWLVRGGVYMSDDILAIAKAHLWPGESR